MTEHLYMALWEYKIIGSGKGGFGSPSLLESHLNQLGKDEWEIIAFTTNPENPLAFQGLARRSTQRDWTLQDAAAAAAKAEAEKLRAEFAAKFQAAQAPVVEDKPTSLVSDAAAPEDGLRRLRDTDRDQDPEALADSEDGEDSLALDSEDELPTFFDYIRPHMRRNQRGPGLSLAVDYLANKIDLSPGEIVGALKECGFEIPEREDDDPVYVEYDGDLFWVNSNRHHQLFINTKEKPRPVFRAVKGQPYTPPEAEDRQASRSDHREQRGGRRQDSGGGQASVAAAAPAETAGRSPEETSAAREPSGDAPSTAPAEAASARSATSSATPAGGGGSHSPVQVIPAGPGGDALLAKLRPMMRRNRRGPGVSGSVSFLSRALGQSDAELAAALAAVGLSAPLQPNDKAVNVEVSGWTYWINKDSRGGLWINGRERRERDRGGRAEPGEAGSGPAVVEADVKSEQGSTSESAESVAADAPSATARTEVPPSTEAGLQPGALELPLAEPASAAPLSLAAVRLHLKPKTRGSGFSGELGAVAAALGATPEALLRVLREAGLAEPAEGQDEEKPATVELGNETIWLERSGRSGAVSIQAKPKPVRKPRSSGATRRGKKSEETAEPGSQNEG